MPQDQTGANKLPLDVERREREESGRRAGRLIQLYLQHTSRLPRLAAHPANDVIDGSVAVYDRLKPRDSIDAMYCTEILALQNAIMSLFADATISRDRDQCLRQAYAGIAALMEAVAVREPNRSQRESPPPRSARRTHAALWSRAAGVRLSIMNGSSFAP
jgi:hypothetical protein